MTQQDLAKAAALGDDTISALETGKRQRPQASTLEALIRALDLEPQDAARLRYAARATRRTATQVAAPVRTPMAAAAPLEAPGAGGVASIAAIPDIAPLEVSLSIEAPLIISEIARKPITSTPLYADRGKRGATQFALATIGPFALLSVALILATVVANFSGAPSVTLWPISQAHVAGWLIYQQWATQQPSIIAMMNGATGAWRPLWPDASWLNQGATTATTESFSSLRAPAYSPARRQLAFLAVDSDSATSVWVATIGLASDGWPVVKSPGPLEVIANCDGCGALTWSPDGAWLLYDSRSGILAYSVLTGKTQRITASVGDHWPSCAPNGLWLAYQRRSDANGGVVVAPTNDCLPLTGPSTRHMLYLNGFNPSWRPMWSPDSAMLAFVALTAHGRWSAWVTRLSDLSSDGSYLTTSNATQISQPGCIDPVWATQSDSGRPVVIYSCDTPTSDQHHGAVYITSGAMATPTWRASLATGTRAEQGGVWLPA